MGNDSTYSTNSSRVCDNNYAKYSTTYWMTRIMCSCWTSHVSQSVMITRKMLSFYPKIIINEGVKRFSTFRRWTTLQILTDTRGQCTTTLEGKKQRFQKFQCFFWWMNYEHKSQKRARYQRNEEPKWGNAWRSEVK